MNTAIPTIEFPSIREYKILNIQEPLLSLSNNGFLCESQYFEQGIKYSLKDCYARESVVKKLKIAESYLPEGLKIKIYDAYRPIEVQRYLWDKYFLELRKKYPDDTLRELERKTSFYVSKPSYDIFNPSLHNTGGAIDVTLITDNGYSLNMGTLFDDFSKRAWTNHFEIYENCSEVKENRRILYNAMIKAGFTNLPSEWWHYDYGTKFWAYFKETDALYAGILNHSLEK